MEPCKEQFGLEEDLLEMSLKRSRCLHDDDSKAANRLFDKLEAKRVEMQRLGAEKCRMVFEEVIRRTDDLDARILFASWLLPLNEPLALELLRQIGGDKANGLAGFTADMTLTEWGSGRMDRYRWPK